MFYKNNPKPHILNSLLLSNLDKWCMLFELGSSRIKFYFDGTFRNQKALARYDWYQKIQFSKFKIFQGMMKSTLLNIDSGCMMKCTFLNIDSCWSGNL